jgi:hypothetical protein
MVNGTSCFLFGLNEVCWEHVELDRMFYKVKTCVAYTSLHVRGTTLPIGKARRSGSQVHINLLESWQ